MTFLTISEVIEIFCSFRLVLEGIDKDKEIPESSRLEFLEKLLANNFTWSDAEDSNCGPLNRRGIADLPLLRALLAIYENRENKVSGKWWDLLFSASRTLLERLLACLNFGFRFACDFYQLWQQHKLSEDESCGDEWSLTWCLRINKFQPEPTYKIHKQQKHWV